jgi:hypothetical protein
MTSMNFRRTLVCAAVATTLGVLAEPATAAPYRGVFDPADFSGAYVINVNPTCLLTSGWHANAGICAATLLSAYADVFPSTRILTTWAAHLRAPCHFELASAVRNLRLRRPDRSFDTALLPQVGEAPSTRRTTGSSRFSSGQMPTYPPLSPLTVLPVRPDPKGRLSSVNNLGIIATAQYLGPAVDIPREPVRSNRCCAEPSARLAGATTTKEKSRTRRFSRSAFAAPVSWGGRLIGARSPPQVISGSHALRGRGRQRTADAVSSCHVCPPAQAASTRGHPAPRGSSPRRLPSPSRCGRRAAARALRAAAAAP